MRSYNPDFPRSSRSDTLSRDTVAGIKQRFPKVADFYHEAGLDARMSIPLFYAILRLQPAGHDRVAAVEEAYLQVVEAEDHADPASAARKCLSQALARWLKRFGRVGWDDARQTEIREYAPAYLPLITALKDLGVLDADGFTVEAADA